MKRLMLGAALVASALVIGAFLIPKGEIVTLEGLDAAGGHHATQLWIAEVEGATYVRAVNPEAAWLARVRLQPDLDLSTLHDNTVAPRPVRAVIVDDDALEAALNEAMSAKYGVANSLVCIFADTDAAVAVRLDSRGPARATSAPQH